ncbi:hypothetical protein [Ruegeria profundi]|uniref:hypothetical protein n=1 Tax=Ruegeria profundi TaxID=1685378 RepID=UPI003C7A970F
MNDYYDFTDSNTAAGRVANFVRGFGGTVGFAVATVWFLQKSEVSWTGSLYAVFGLLFFVCTGVAAAYAYDALLKWVTGGKDLRQHFEDYKGRRLFMVVCFVLLTFFVVLLRLNGS